MLKSSLLSALMISFFLSGCATNSVNITTSKGVEAQKELKDAIAEYYSLKKSGDFEKLYMMEAPSFRYLNSFELYKNYNSGTLSSFESININGITKNSENRYTVNLSALEKGAEKKYNEIWIRVDGTYFHVLDDFMLFKY